MPSKQTLLGITGTLIPLHAEVQMALTSGKKATYMHMLHSVINIPSSADLLILQNNKIK